MTEIAQSTTVGTIFLILSILTFLFAIVCLLIIRASGKNLSKDDGRNEVSATQHAKNLRFVA
jgi:Na+-transporting methylmalonyl-CoA/oxaloacetate decarboxylase gamma subunit